MALPTFTNRLEIYMLLGFGISIAEMLIVPIMPLLIGGILVFLTVKRIRADAAKDRTPLELMDYPKRAGCLGIIGAVFLLIGGFLALSSFLMILSNLF